MSEPQDEIDASPECPRCSTKGVPVVARSPVPNVWTMHLCPVCFYSWRSSEPAEATKAAAFSPAFRVDPDRFAEGMLLPGIPPLRETR